MGRCDQLDHQFRTAQVCAQEKAAQSLHSVTPHHSIYSLTRSLAPLARLYSLQVYKGKLADSGETVAVKVSYSLLI
jgi:hypothetical protein